MLAFIDRAHPAQHTKPVAIIDVGSNSVRMVVYHALQRVPLPIFNEKYMCSLGRDMAQTGRLYEEGKQEARTAIIRFMAMAERLKVVHIDILATAALRDAEDGRAFVEQLEQWTGHRVRIISGKKEAELAALGVISSFNSPHGVSADMGGGSMELAYIDDNKSTKHSSYALGGLRLAGQCGSDVKALSKVITAALSNTEWLCKGHNTLYAVGGSFRAIAKAYMRFSHYPLSILHGYRINRNTLEDWIDFLCKHTNEELSELSGIARKRVDTIIPAACVLKALLTYSNAKHVIFSVSGIREGYLHTKLVEEEAMEDPLLASASEVAAMAGRYGKYARELYHWMNPLFEQEDVSHKRLRQALCMLSEIAWTIDPNFRGEWSYHRVIQSSIKGIRHKERVILALAMYYRYESKWKIERDEFALVDDASHLWAKTAGMAANLAALLSAGKAGTLKHATLGITKDEVQLALDEEISMMYSAIVQKRVEGLGETFSAFRKFCI